MDTREKPKPTKLILKWAKKVRQTIEELGGTMPEDLPTPEEDLKKLEQRLKYAEKKMINGSELPNSLEDGE